MPKWKILCIILAATAFLLLLVAIGTSFDLKDREDHAFAENMQILTSQLKNGSRDKFARIYIYIDTSLSIDEQKSRDLDREKNDVINSIIPVASVNDELHVYTFDSDRIQVCPPLPNQALSATEGQQLPTLTPVDRHQLESEIESGEVPRARIRMLQPLLKAAVEVTNKCKVQVAGIEWRPAHCHGGHDPQCFTDISLLAFNIGRDLQESSGDGRENWVVILSDFREDKQTPRIVDQPHFSDTKLVLIHPPYPPGLTNPAFHVDYWAAFFQNEGAAVEKRFLGNLSGGGSPLLRNPLLGLSGDVPAEPKDLGLFFEAQLYILVKRLAVVGVVAAVALYFRELWQSARQSFG